MIGKVVFIASAAAAASVAYIGLREEEPSPPTAPKPVISAPAAHAATHHAVTWIPLTVGVLIVLCVAGAILSYLRRPAVVLNRWHILLEADANGRTVELRRGHADLPTSDHIEAGQMICDLWVATYGEPKEGVRLHASAAPAS